MNKDSAVLQGAFLLSDKLCLPSSLASVQKDAWSRVGRPILEAIREICGQDHLGSRPNPTVASWKKKMVCVVWLKLLCREAEEDAEVTWRENPLFSLQNSLPEVNRVVLLELVKSTSAAHIFASFLLCLPEPQMCSELEKLAEHVMSSPTREDDVQLFLEVWWELWKGRDDQKAGGEDNLEKMFASQCVRLSSTVASLSPQAAKKLKLDTLDLPASNADVLHVLIHALKGMKDHVSSADLCFQSLYVSLSALYTAFLIDQEVVFPTKDKMHILCKVISMKEKNDQELSPELIRETLRDFRASHVPSQFQPSRMKLKEALKIITELTQFWQSRGLLTVQDSSNPIYTAFQLEKSVQRLLTALDQTPAAVGESDDQKTVKETLMGLLKSLALPDMESSPEVSLKVTTIIITHRLEDCENFAALFASEASWAACDERWLDCLEKNQVAFRQHDTLIGLSSTLMRKLHSGSSNVSRCRKLMKITADIFSTLPLEDKNRALAAQLGLSSRGFFGCSVPSSVTEGFEQELNMAFNCIIQGGPGASAAAPQGNLNTAASLVARVAFQNPEAALRSCCHSAVFNKGAFSLMAKILQQLPGLRGGDKAQKNEEEIQAGEEHTAEEKDAFSGSSLFCRCLQDMIRTKLLSASEKEQLLRFLGLLMVPVAVGQGEEMRQSFLHPQEVVNSFVLPNLSAMGCCSVDADLSLQLLHAALSVDVHGPASSPHWVLHCSPFPLLYILAQLHHQTLRCWEQPPGGTVRLFSMDTRDLLVAVLSSLGQVVGAEVAADPSSWSRALFWFYSKMEELDWTIRFHLKPVWGQHFKNEAPSSLLAVCDLPEEAGDLSRCLLPLPGIDSSPP